MSILQYNHPAQEPNAERVALIQGCNPRTQSAYKMHPYPFFEVRIMRVDGDGGFRWAEWNASKGGGYLVDGLILRASVENLSKNRFTGFDYGFEPLGHFVRHDDAENMYRTLRKLQTVSAVHAREGNHVEMLIWMTDMLKKLGVTEFVSYVHDDMRGDLDNPANFVPLKHMRARMAHVKTVAEAMCGERLQDVA
jgi:hypothetical protein